MSEENRNEQDRADEMSEESFPGSDAPSSYAGRDKGPGGIRPSGEGGSADEDNDDDSNKDSNKDADQQ